MSDQGDSIAAAIDAVAKRLTAEIVAPPDSYNGGRLSRDQASGLAALAVSTLLTQGWALTLLPECQPSGIAGQVCWPVESADDGAKVTVRHDGRIFSDGVSNPYRHPLHARSHAAALLAAVDDMLGASFEETR